MGGLYRPPRTAPKPLNELNIDPKLVLRRPGAGNTLVQVGPVTFGGQGFVVIGDVDLLQVGARNMHNYSLLRALGQLKKPILLKRGFSATFKEWLLAAEYLLAGGNDQVILCERGIRTFEPETRYTLDLASVA